VSGWNPLLACAGLRRADHGTGVLGGLGHRAALNPRGARGAAPPRRRPALEVKSHRSFPRRLGAQGWQAGCPRGPRQRSVLAGIRVGPAAPRAGRADKPAQEVKTKRQPGGRDSWPSAPSTRARCPAPPPRAGVQAPRAMARDPHRLVGRRDASSPLPGRCESRLRRRRAAGGAGPALALPSSCLRRPAP